MHCAVVGGGINGVMSAWALARRGHQVDLYERAELMGATSSASTKLIHGGLRYLEHGEFRLVREALRERLFWICSAPHLVHKIELILPVFESSRRPRWVMRCGLMLYDLLAGKSNLGKHRWLGRKDVIRLCPELNATGLLGAFTFYDAQMDDRALGLWAADQAALAGVNIKKTTKVSAISENGELQSQGQTHRYEMLFNIAGPWSEDLLRQSGIRSSHRIDPIRGSHLLLSRTAEHAFLVEVPNEDRFCFILPYQGRTLLGTTEVRQTLNEPIECSQAEQSYLTRVFNHYIHPPMNESEIVGRFAGVRPLIYSHAKQAHTSRDYVVERHGRVFTVFGGKWTTSHALGERVACDAEAAYRDLARK
jgi:glycerol-3-phosphate dehydrogenase